MLPRRAAVAYLVLAVLVVGVVAVALLVGQGSLRDPAIAGTLLELRATRVAAAFLAGAALGGGGPVAQGLFRSPLVSPDVLGTAGGSMLGGQLALLAFAGLPLVRNLPHVGPQMVVPLGCLVGAELALLVLLAFAR